MTKPVEFTEAEKRRIVAKYRSGINIQTIKKSFSAWPVPPSEARIVEVLKAAKVYMSQAEWGKRFNMGR